MKGLMHDVPLPRPTVVRRAEQQLPDQRLVTAEAGSERTLRSRFAAHVLPAPGG